MSWTARVAKTPNLRSAKSAVFFFSSRRRHTRLQGDWSSDVCSSDLCTFRSTVDLDQLRKIDELVGARDFAAARNSTEQLQIGRASCRERKKVQIVAETENKKEKEGEAANKKRTVETEQEKPKDKTPE